MCVLPKDITMEILSKLPVKSLCRFKCVSKKWQYLISHHRFMKMHLSRARTRLLGDGMIDLFDVDLDTISANDDKISLLSLEFPGQCNCEGYFYGGSCNGLLCIFSACLKLYLYNPSINKCKFIRKYRNRKFLHGFGYAESIENYKIVRVLYPGNVVKVYSVKDRSWSTIQSDLRIPEEYFNWNEFDIMEYSNAGVYLNGAVHWAFENHEGLCVIAAFDLVEDKFKILPPPGNVHMGKRGAWCGYTLGVLRGRLCLVKERRGHDNQIWVMEEYGVQRSWTRILILRKFARLKPLCFLNNSETMLSAHLEGLAFYDLKDRVLKKADIGVIADGDYCEMTFGDENNNSDLHVYTESLVPPTYKPDENTEDPMYEYWFK